MGEISRTVQVTQVTRLNRFLSERDLGKIIKHHGTPVYVTDEQTLHKKVKELLDAYKKFKGDVKVAYSIKANFTPAVIKAFMKDGVLFDATSTGELHFHSMCKGNPENIVYTSVTEELDEYEHALKSGVRRIVVSSYNGLVNLAEAARALNIKPLTMIRINPEVGVKAEVRASYRHGKFGVPFNTNAIDSATNIIKKIMTDDMLIFEGFHFHLGSQITDFACFTNALEKLDSFVGKMKKEYPDFSFNTIDIGGGTPVFYGENVPAPEKIASSMVSKLNQMAEAHNNFTLIIESGRFLTAESTVLVSRIVNTKDYANDKFVIVDAGYHLLLDSALLKQEYPQEVVFAYSKNNGNNNSNSNSGSHNNNNSNNSSNDNASRVHLAGRLCDTYDVFPISKASKLDNPEVNKYVMFYNVGAYSTVFNMPFHCQTKPTVVMKKNNGQLTVVRRPTTIEQLFAEEGGDL
ncbi:MAG: diaminopimelate decarboxylase family protein [Nitrososphaerales archaeon]